MLVLWQSGRVEAPLDLTLVGLGLELGHVVRKERLRPVDEVLDLLCLGGGLLENLFERFYGLEILGLVVEGRELLPLLVHVGLLAVAVADLALGGGEGGEACEEKDLH